MADEEEDFNAEAQEYVDEAEDDLDEATDMRDAQMDSYAETYPQAGQKNDLYSWFWKVVRIKKPFHLAKVGNLSSAEIGFHRISNRDALNLWVLGHTFHHPTFGNYFANVSKITSATSMAKRGWFMDLSISQKKVRERKRQQSGTESWKIFKRNRNPEQPG